MKPGILSGLWVSVLVTLSTVALLAITSGMWPGLPVRTNIMELLPALRDDPVLLDALQRSNRAVSRKLVILVGDPDPAVTTSAVALVEQSLQQQDFANAGSGFSPDAIHDTGRYYYQWRQVLLANSQREMIQRGDYAALEAQLTEAVYSPVGGVNATLLANDPLLTFYHFLRELPGMGSIQSSNGQLQLMGDDRLFRMLVIDISTDVFDMAMHPRYTQWRDTLQRDIAQQFPHTELLLMGAIQHAVWGANSARQEVSTIGNGSLLGIIALVLIVFRSLRALMISLLPLGSGVLAGLVVTLLCFDNVHLITLVFGSSVIGVAMDYSLHYLSEHFKNIAGQDTHRQVFPGITMAMLTSAMAYAAMGFAPFPVLQQIAVFSCTGLFMAWLTVVSLYPRLMPAATFSDLRYLRWSGQLDAWLRRLFARRGSHLLITLLAAAMLPGVLHLHANDDLRLLQAPEPGISAMEQRVQALTGLQPSGRFLLIEGTTPEQMLQREEALRHWQQQQASQLALSLASDYLPSQQRQQENLTAQRALYQQFAMHWRDTLGLPDDVITRAAEAVKNEPSSWLTTDMLGGSPLTPLLERFQITQTERGWITNGLLNGNSNTTSLQAWVETQPGIHWMDPVADISSLFKHYREQTGWMMVFAYAAIALLLCWRYGMTQSWRVMLAPALAAWFTLGLLGYAGVALNLFHVLALLLVLGVGIDYSIFFAESHSHRDSTMLAVLLSTATTLLSFGLLALSITAAIRSFGTVVSIGMVCALLFSPLAQHPQLHQR